jgi:hypothetical protein
MLTGLGVAIAGAAQAAPQRQGTLVGIVTRGPITPVCVAEQPCDEPAAHVTLVFSSGGRDSARVTTSGEGRYRVRLARGTYSVRRARYASVDARLTPHAAHVTGGRELRIDFSIDTGIR